MSHTIANWDPEDTVAWEAGNKNIARRNLIWSVPAEHIGFRSGPSGP
jgi:MFS transporter, NNP family, nitrate/nitrite transporter